MADVWLYPDPTPGSTRKLGIMNADSRHWEVSAGGVKGTKALPEGNYRMNRSRRKTNTSA